MAFRPEEIARVPRVNIRAAVRTPLAQTPRIGVPPANVTPPKIRRNSDGSIYVGNAPLATRTQQDETPLSLVIPPSDNNQDAPRPVFDPLKYGDADTFSVVFTGAGEVLALPKAIGVRTSLLIQNLTVVGNIFYCFNRRADAVTCVAVGPGGSRLFDNSVPQGDLHIASTGAGIVIVEYINDRL